MKDIYDMLLMIMYWVKIINHSAWVVSPAKNKPSISTVMSIDYVDDVSLYRINQNLSNLIQYTKSCKGYVYSRLPFTGNAYPG